MDKCIARLRIQNDFKMLMEEPLSNLNYDIIINDNTYSSEELNVVIEFLPKFGVYIGEYVIFRINFTPKYPFLPPSIICCSNFLHPNVDLLNKSLSLSILNHWNCIYTIKSLCEKLSDLFLTIDKKYIPKNPYNENLRKIYLNNKTLFKTIADLYFQGREIEVFQVLSTIEEANKFFTNNKYFPTKIENQDEFNSFTLKRTKKGEKYHYHQNKIKKENL